MQVVNVMTKPEGDLARVLALLHAEMERLQEALVGERGLRTASREEAVLSLYKEDLLTTRDVERLLGIDYWQVCQLLADHPEYQQVDARAVLGRALGE
jgi:hypothetical protein